MKSLEILKPIKANRLNRDFYFLFVRVTSCGPIFARVMAKSSYRAHPRDFLSRYSGIVVTDEYQAYHTIDNEREDLTVAGYWIHAKRGFSEVIKSLGETDSKGTIAKEAADRISMIFHLDNRLDGLSVTERKRRRNIDIKPKVNDFFALVKNISTQETSVARQPSPCNTVLIKKNISVYS